MQQQVMDGGPALQMPMPHNMLESEMIGAIKIKDGLFIGDELASTVSLTWPNASSVFPCPLFESKPSPEDQYESSLLNAHWLCP